MTSLAALTIMMLEFLNVQRIEIKYFGPNYNPDPLELLSRLSLEDMVKYRHHVINGWLAFCVFSMGKMFP